MDEMTIEEFEKAIARLKRNGYIWANNSDTRYMFEDCETVEELRQCVEDIGEGVYELVVEEDDMLNQYLDELDDRQEAVYQVVRDYERDYYIRNDFEDEWADVIDKIELRNIKRKLGVRSYREMAIERPSEKKLKADEFNKKLKAIAEFLDSVCFGVEPDFGIFGYHFDQEFYNLASSLSDYLDYSTTLFGDCEVWIEKSDGRAVVTLGSNKVLMGDDSLSTKIMSFTSQSDIDSLISNNYNVSLKLIFTEDLQDVIAKNDEIVDYLNDIESEVLDNLEIIPNSDPVYVNMTEKDFIVKFPFKIWEKVKDMYKCY
ncbi:MAG: hypothetical protein HUJ68_01945 [Clostridia bacterium]|mgnify:CR=1 FL=1|nr:hypothetical protein [Clostridia bacterium]